MYIKPAFESLIYMYVTIYKVMNVRFCLVLVFFGFFLKGLLAKRATYGILKISL